jgi:hypothetical protein
MKPYPLGIDNPILIKGVIGTHKWALYWRKDMQKIATFSNQFTAYQMGYDETDVNVASTMFQKKEFPLTMYGRTYNTEEEYFSAIHDFMNGM